MTARLESGVRVMIAVAACALALWAVAMVATPAAAEAQETDPTNDARNADRVDTAHQDRNAGGSTGSVVVSPGDTLWSISSERLGPSATPRQIATDTERIYVLNRDMIGTDPGLILPGQVLSLPATDRPSTAPPSPRDRRNDTRGRETARADQTGQRERAGREGTAQTPDTARIGDVADEAARQPALPDAASAPRVPAVRSVDSGVTRPDPPVVSFLETVRSAVGDVAESFTRTVGTTDRDRLLGWGIIALTLAVTGLAAWRLPLNREPRGSKTWIVGSGYRLPPAAPRASRPALSANGSKNGGSPTPERKMVDRAGSGDVARRRLTRLRERPQAPSRPARQRRNPDARRLLRGAIGGGERR